MSRLLFVHSCHYKEIILYIEFHELRRIHATSHSNKKWKKFYKRVRQIIKNNLFYDDCVYICAKQHHSNTKDFYLNVQRALLHSMKFLDQLVTTYYEDKKAILNAAYNRDRTWHGPQMQIGERPIFWKEMFDAFIRAFENMIKHIEKQYKEQNLVVFAYDHRMLSTSHVNYHSWKNYLNFMPRITEKGYI